MLLLLGKVYARTARVVFAEGMYRECAKLIHLDPDKVCVGGGEEGGGEGGGRDWGRGGMRVGPRQGRRGGIYLAGDGPGKGWVLCMHVHNGWGGLHGLCMGGKLHEGRAARSQMVLWERSGVR